MRILFAIVLALGAVHSAMAAERDRSLAVGGMARLYTLISPDRQTEPLPLIIVYHGGGQTAERARAYTRFDEWAKRENFIAVYPQGLGNNWNDGRQSAGLLDRPASNANDIEFTAQIIAQLVAEGKVNQSRVFLTGASNGGMMAMYAGCQLPGRIAGIAPVVANQPTSWRCKATGLPALFIHGTEDEYMPFAGGQIAAKKSRSNLGTVLGADKTIELYKTMNGCTDVKETKRLDNVGRDQTIAVVTEFNCIVAPLKRIVIEGGGHTWPGARTGIIADWILGRTSEEVDATAEIRTFFKSLPSR